MMAFNGVRNSCDMFAKKADLSLSDSFALSNAILKSSMAWW